MITGKYIKEKRVALGMSRSELARRSEINRTTLINIEDYGGDGKFRVICRILIELDENITQAYIEMERT